MSDIRVQREAQLASLKKRGVELERWQEALTEVLRDVASLPSAAGYNPYSTEIVKLVEQDLQGKIKRTQQERNDLDRRAAVVQRALFASTTGHGTYNRPQEQSVGTETETTS